MEQSAIDAVIVRLDAVNEVGVWRPSPPPAAGPPFRWLRLALGGPSLTLHQALGE